MDYPPPNPDSRELPPGWIQQYNWEFYVNTREQPPRSVWEHPLGPLPQGYNRSPGYQPSYNPPPPPGYSHPGNYGNVPQGGYPGGGYPSSYPQEDRGFFGGTSGQLQQPQRKKHGMGTGAMLGAGAAGLVGGAVLGELFEHHEEREREEAYDDGYDRGYDQGFDQGFDERPDFGGDCGGDFGGDFGGGGW
ncbi:hypothetical protein EDD17DRAFT_1502913 [Pisolithus thermaeus]|nr:hypothetical protein EDD17DRAFT_1502913 [Pisolithus thermaeus]